MNKFSLHPGVQMFPATIGKHHFFGYYDKCPWSGDGRFLLAMETDFLDRLPRPGDAASIGLVDLGGDRKFRKFAETRAWNFQQGCMLQWLGPDYNRRVIFNDFRDGKFVSVIFDIVNGREEKIIPFPIYAVHPKGCYALSLNFSRLDNAREGYGYKGVSGDLEENFNDDGIYFVNLETGKFSLTLPLTELCGHKPANSMNEGKHWVDHLTFNPSGARFAFFERRQSKNGPMYSRFYTANSDGSALFLLLDSGMASHFAWKNNDEILIWGRPEGFPASIGKRNLLREVFVPMYHLLLKSPRLRQLASGDAFLFFKDRSSGFKKIGEGELVEDGHCSFSPDGKWLLTDTYAGEEHRRKLLLFNLDLKKLVEIGQFYSLPDGVRDDWDSSSLRCDLHPRWSRNGTQICFDSVHEGTRQVYVLDVKQLVS